MVEEENGIALTTSLIAVEIFKVDHKHILTKIRSIIRSVENMADPYADLRLFFQGEYKDSYGRSQKMYKMTRDGFSLLAMAMSGSIAFEWRVKFLLLFNKMEDKIREIEEAGLIDLANDLYKALSEYRFVGATADMRTGDINLEELDKRWNLAVSVYKKLND